jgi:para-nitrobenzyl esterase
MDKHRRKLLQGGASAVIGLAFGARPRGDAAIAAAAQAIAAKPIEEGQASLRHGRATGQLFWTVETTSGRIQGIANGTIKEFKGVPYGASTGGSNRYMAPKKPTPWTGVRDCIGFGQISPQVPMDLSYDYAIMLHWDGHVGPGGMGEDCLNLNVWTPGVNDGARRAVVVSFHGGGWNTGSGNGSMYDGAQLARFGDVVVVTVNHRLASLGYAHFADLGAPAEFANSGVCGVMDMVASLEWVRDNIERFGGDPNKVMICGQSGGGSKTSTLMAVPSARGLFQRSAAQSGPALRQLTREEGTVQAERLLRALGLSKGAIGDIRKLSWERILEAQVAADGDFRPVVDGKVLPRHPFDPVAPMESADVPMIISTTLHDASLRFENFGLDEAGLLAVFRKSWGPRAEAILAAYRKESPKERPFLIEAKAYTDAVRGNAMLQAERKAARGRAPAYFYVWNWATDAFDGRYGACHALDLDASFHLYRSSMCGSGHAEGRLMCDRMAATWVAFAKTGNPANSLIPSWPAYDARNRATMIFDKEMRVVNDYRGDFVRLIGETGPSAVKG